MTTSTTRTGHGRDEATDALLAARLLTRGDDCVGAIHHALTIQAVAHVAVDVVVRKARAGGAPGRTWEERPG